MKNDAKKNSLFLVAAGLVLVMVNTAVLMGTRNGRIAPIDNFALWGAFAVLSVCSLLWAVSLLGLQPMVVAASYAAGGFMAFQGVRVMPDVNVAEIATAGATYGAFGALVVGNATTPVRLAFFSKRQVPFVFIIVALLLVDGLLNSRVSGAGWGVILNALVFPFVFSGVIIGLVWMVFARIRVGQGSAQALTEKTDEAEPIADAVIADDEAAQLMFSVPESIEVDESMEEAAALSPDPEPVVEMEDVPPVPVVERVSAELDPIEEDSSSDNFFPLEIDKGEEIILPEGDAGLMDVAARVAESAPEAERAVEADPVAEDIATLSRESTILGSDPEPIEEPGEPAPEERKADSSDWLNGHLDLLNKLN